MAHRNGGCDIYPAEMKVRERGGAIFLIDRLEVAGDVLYYGRHTPDVGIPAQLRSLGPA